MRTHRTSVALGLTLALAACSSGGATETECVGAKCDDPGSTATEECKATCGGDSACADACREAAALQHCQERRADALSGSQRVFTPEAVRWACADVEGVTPSDGDSRGKEYCEYFAVVALPPGASTAPELVDPGRVGGSPLDVELDEEQIFALEDELDSVVGQCVFTAWHADRRNPLPVCDGSDCPELELAPGGTPASWLEESGSYAMSDEHLRMKGTTNSNGAAVSLLADCLQSPLAGDPEDPADPLHDDFMRGCMKAHSLFQTEWRRSDSAICAAAGRLAECGCAIDPDMDGSPDLTDARAISEALVPAEPRGFHLGGWADRDELPTGCRTVPTGDDRSVVVSCDVTAGELLSGAADMQGFCRDRYAGNVVVYIDVVPETVVCAPPPQGQYSETCTASPWVL